MTESTKPKMRNGVVLRGSTYYICYQLPGGPGQKSRKKWEACKGMTRKQAEARLVERKHAIGKGTLTSKTITFSELAGQWLDLQRQEHRKRTTITVYTGTVKHLSEHFGDINIKDIRVPEIRKYIAVKLETLSARSVAQHRQVLRAILQEAVRCEYTIRNYCDDVKAPSAKPKAITLLTEPQIELLKTHASEQARMIIMLAHQTGLRAGEITGLRWQDLDIERGIISIVQTFTHGQFDTPKSFSSVRDVEISYDLAAELKNWKKQAMANEHGLVFSRNGKPIAWPDWLRANWNTLLKRLELPKTKFHSLRHLYGSRLIAEGIPVSIVSRLMGHSTITITHNVYCHEMPDARDGFRDTLQGIFGGQSSKVVAKSLRVVGSNNR